MSTLSFGHDVCQKTYLVEPMTPSLIDFKIRSPKILHPIFTKKWQYKLDKFIILVPIYVALHQYTIHSIWLLSVVLVIRLMPAMFIIYSESNIQLQSRDASFEEKCSIDKDESLQNNPAMNSWYSSSFYLSRIRMCFNFS